MRVLRCAFTIEHLETAARASRSSSRRVEAARQPPAEAPDDDHRPLLGTPTFPRPPRFQPQSRSPTSWTLNEPHTWAQETSSWPPACVAHGDRKHAGDDGRGEQSPQRVAHTSSLDRTRRITSSVNRSCGVAAEVGGADAVGDRLEARFADRARGVRPLVAGELQQRRTARIIASGLAMFLPNRRGAVPWGASAMHASETSPRGTRRSSTPSPRSCRTSASPDRRGSRRRG